MFLCYRCRKSLKKMFGPAATFFPLLFHTTGTMLQAWIATYKESSKKVEGLHEASREIKILVLRWGHRGNGVCIILINRLGWRQT